MTLATRVQVTAATVVVMFLAIAHIASAQDRQEQIAARAGLEQNLNAQVPLDAVFRD